MTYLSLTNSMAVHLWAQIAALYILARIFGLLARRIGQPDVVGALLAGVALSPSVLGAVWPAEAAFMLPRDGEANSLAAILGFCLLMVLLALGAETDLVLLRRLGGAVVAVSAGSIVVPLAAGAATAYVVAAPLVSGHRVAGAILLGGALGVSSLPIIARLVVELGVGRRDFGQLAFACATVNDIYGFLLLVCVTAASRSSGLRGVLLPFGGLLVLLMLFSLAGQPTVDRLLRHVRARGPNPAGSFTVCVGVALAAAAAMQAVHVEAALGAFFAGIAVGRSRFQHSPSMRQLGSFTDAIFAPLYFAGAGLQVNLRSVDRAGAVAVLAALLAVAVISKGAGVALGARCARLQGRETTALAVLLNGRGTMQVVIGTAGLQTGLLSASAYTVLLVVSVAGSLAVAPVFRRLVSSWPGSGPEQERLAHEERLRRNVLVRAQRILIPAGDGTNAEAAAVIVDRAWPPEAEITILSARPADTTAPRSLGIAGRPIRQKATGVADIVAGVLAEANLGYGVIGIGTSRYRAPRRTLSPLIEGVLGKSPLPVLFVRRAATSDDPMAQPRRIAVAVTATTASRAAEEVAASLCARAGSCLYIVHVVPPSPQSAAVTMPQPAAEPWPHTAALAILDEAEQRAASQGLSTRAVRYPAARPADGLSAFVDEEQIDLLILGTRLRRVQGASFLGHTVENVLEHLTSADIGVIALPDAALAESADQPYTDRQRG